MKFLQRAILTALLAVFVTGAAAQAAVLTLDDAIDMALKNRASIIAARGSEELAKAGKRAALGAFLPRVSAVYDWNKTKYSNQKFAALDSAGTLFEGEGEDNTVNRKSMDFGGEISFTLPDAVFNYLAAKEDAVVAHLDVISSEQDLILSVDRKSVV